MQVLFLCCYFSTASEKRQTAALYTVMEGEIVVLKLCFIVLPSSIIKEKSEHCVNMECRPGMRLTKMKKRKRVGNLWP